MAKGQENFNAILDALARDYLPDEQADSPIALDRTKRTILRYFKKNPSVRDAFSNMIKYADTAYPPHFPNEMI